MFDLVKLSLVNYKLINKNCFLFSHPPYILIQNMVTLYDDLWIVQKKVFCMCGDSMKGRWSCDFCDFLANLGFLEKSKSLWGGGWVEVEEEVVVYSIFQTISNPPKKQEN